MKHAISELTRIAECTEHNAPFHEAAGDAVQAELCWAVARDCRDAIKELVALESPFGTVDRRAD